MWELAKETIDLPLGCLQGGQQKPSTHSQRPPPQIQENTSVAWQPRGKWMVSLVNSHTNATRIGWHLWEIYLTFAPGLPPGWILRRDNLTCVFFFTLVTGPRKVLEP